MAKKLYLGAGNSSRECSKLYIGESSIARKIIKGYIGVNGSARQFYPLYKWKRYSVNSTSTLDKTNYGMITYYVSSSGATNRYLPAYESSLRATPSGILVLGVSWIDALYNFDIIFSYQYSINGQTVTNMWDMSNSVNQTYSTLYAFVPQTGGRGWSGPCHQYIYTSQTLTSIGSYLEDVYSDSRNAYPDNGILGSYWYVYDG